MSDKRCSKCGETKPPDAFYRDNRARDGLKHQCRTCHKAAVRARSLATGYAAQRKWNAANRQSLNSYNRAWKKEHSDQLRPGTLKWRESNWWIARGHRVKGGVKRRADPSAVVADVDLEAVFERDRGICQVCHEPVERLDTRHPRALAFDHIQPLKHGGAHTFCNLQVTHRACNLRKGDTWPWPPMDEPTKK